VLYAFAPLRLRHGVVAFAIGGASSFAALLVQRPHMLQDLVFGGSYILAGAWAALVCGLIADHISRKRAEAPAQV
jgi:hypothetical protein